MWQTIYTSLIDRTLKVLGRAVLFAMPAGALIWLTCNINLGGQPIATHLIHCFASQPSGLILQVLHLAACHRQRQSVSLKL